MTEDKVSLMRESQYDIELQKRDSKDLIEKSYRFGNCYDTITYSESLDIDVSVTAPDLHDLYRYHVFFSHCNEDKTWVSNMINRLETDPYNYKCSYGDFQNTNNLSFFQSALCSAMLSERVVVVLTPNYVKTAWQEFREILQNLTEKSLYRQRMLVVMLKDCLIPDQLQHMGFLDARESDFFPCFVKYLGSDRLPRSSDSFASEMTCILYSPSNYVNGQVLATIGIHICGKWRAKLVCADDENIPTPLCCHGVNIKFGEYMDVIQTMCQVTDRDTTVQILFSLRPLVLLIAAGLIWFIVFVFVMVYIKDEPKQSALGIRLAVFPFPLLFVVYGYGLRWKRQQLHKKIYHSMMLSCIDLNENFYRTEKPVLLTVVVSKDGTFYIQFVYFCIDDCTIDLELFLNTCSEDELDRFSTLITSNKQNFLSEKAFGERLLIFVSCAFLHYMILRQLPCSSQERHTNQNTCLCQFVEMFLAEYFRNSSSCSLVTDFKELLQKQIFKNVGMKKDKDRKSSSCVHEDFSVISA